MRRHLLRFLPIFMLALMVQVAAPIGACFARSIAIADPLAGASLCLGAGGDHAANGSEDHHMRDGACAVCAASHAAAPPVPRASDIVVSQHAFAVVWHAYEPQARVAKLLSRARARAPPILS